eukprot:403351899
MISDPLTRSPIVHLVFVLARSVIISTWYFIKNNQQPYYDASAEGPNQQNYKEYVSQREGFKLADTRKINSINIMNYFFILGDVLIMFLTVLSFISDEFESIENNVATLVWQILILLSCGISIIIRVNIQSQIRNRYILKSATIAENYHHLFQIVLMIFGVWPQYQQEQNQDQHLIGCLKFIQIFMFVRLLRFILRFTCAFVLMMAACTQWLCRKKVKKGLVSKSRDTLLVKINIPDLQDYDGLPLPDMGRTKGGNDSGIMTPEFSMDDALLTEQQKQERAEKQKIKSRESYISNSRKSSASQQQNSSHKHKPMREMKSGNMSLFLSNSQLQV